ncbi:hypothetical protein R1flu_028685 [Riccia fluitans]|uniref:Cell growth-regulating nucleolar protein n=1 Tax=Riccia fluitans TaxID=41844 RepID=A0ABD1XME7_9MARC
MVWFQCEDCGENLKKPKLTSHFNRCSAHKLSCIDCGVIFDQQSVQAHTSCVSEVEKYGPKGVSKHGNSSAAKPKNGKAPDGPEVDLSRGLTQRPPWSCTLCNVKATSRETLDLHAQGKKHRAKAKAATLKEAPSVEAKDATDATDAKVGTEEVDGDRLKSAVGSGGTKYSPEVSRPSAEKKRKNEQVDGADEVEGEVRTTKKEKKSKKEPVSREAQDAPPDSASKKRKHEEEEQDKATDSKESRKKNKKKTQTSAAEEEMRHTPEEERPKATDVVDIAHEQKKKKEKKGKKAKIESLDHDQNQVVNENRKHDPLVSGAFDTHAATDVNGKRAKKANANSAEEAVTPQPVKSAVGGKSKGEKKKHKKVVDKSEETPGKENESMFHEVSFREWLGDEDGNGNGGTPTHPPIVDKSGEDSSMEPRNLDSEQAHAVSKVVKWKKVISEALGKSPDGGMKKKDLSKAVLSVALKAAEASSVSLDKIVLKEELMRQIRSNPKFVLEGKHVMLASGAK